MRTHSKLTLIGLSIFFVLIFTSSFLLTYFLNSHNFAYTSSEEISEDTQKTKTTFATITPDAAKIDILYKLSLVATILDTGKVLQYTFNLAILSRAPPIILIFEPTS